MYIIKTLVGKEANKHTIALQFTNEENMKKAATILRKTGAEGYAAEVKNINDLRGRLINHWNVGQERHYLGLAERQRPYADYRWWHYGNKEMCKAEEEETNNKATCWASVSAAAYQVVDDLWAVEFTDPYKD